MSGAVGSRPSLMRKGWPVASERASLASHSDCGSSSSQPRSETARASRTRSVNGWDGGGTGAAAAGVGSVIGLLHQGGYGCLRRRSAAIIGAIACSSGLAPEAANQRFPDKRSNSSGRPVGRVLHPHRTARSRFCSEQPPACHRSIDLAGQKESTVVLQIQIDLAAQRLQQFVDQPPQEPDRRRRCVVGRLWHHRRGRGAFGQRFHTAGPAPGG
jgi:hypothetical protein